VPGEGREGPDVDGGIGETCGGQALADVGGEAIGVDATRRDDIDVDTAAGLTNLVVDDRGFLVSGLAITSGWMARSP